MNEEIKPTSETNKEHIERLYGLFNNLISSFVEIKERLNNIESNLKLLVWVQEQKRDDKR